MSTPTAATYAPPRSRPILVSILSVLIGIFGFFWVLLGALVLVGSAAAHFFGGAPTFSQFGLTGAIAGAIILVVGLIIMGLAVGLWHLRLWALVLTLLFLIVEMVSYGLQGAYVSFGFIVSLILFLYLLAVSRHFR